MAVTSVYEVRGSELIRYKGNQSNIEIPEGITKVGDEAFADCTTIVSVKFPSTIKEIGIMAFSGCVSLTDILIPYSVVTIHSCAFQKCTNLIHATLPRNASIGADIFRDCCKLENITIK